MLFNSIKHRFYKKIAKSVSKKDELFDTQ